MDLKQAVDRDEKTATTLLIIDDQPDFCGLVRDLLRPHKEFQVVAEGYEGITALSLVEKLQPDVVLLDIGYRAFMV